MDTYHPKQPTEYQHGFKRVLDIDDSNIEQTAKSLKTSTVDITTAGKLVFADEPTRIVWSKLEEFSAYLPASIELGGLEVDNLHQMLINAAGNEEWLPTSTDESSITAFATQDKPKSSPRRVYVGDTTIFDKISARVRIIRNEESSTALTAQNSPIQPFTEHIISAPTAKIPLGSIAPHLAGSQWGAADLIETQLEYVGGTDPSGDSQSRGKGVYLSSKMQMAELPDSEHLLKFLEVKELLLDFTTSLGPERKYNSQLGRDFVLKGTVLRDVQHSIFKFKTIGVELTAKDRSADSDAEAACVLSYSLFGVLEMSLPGVTKMCEYNFKIGNDNGWYMSLGSVAREMNNAFGVAGMTLWDVKLIRRFGSDSPRAPFEVAAQIKLRNAMINVHGTFLGPFFDLKADVGDLAFADLQAFFLEVTGEKLLPIEFDIALTEMKLHLKNDNIKFHGAVTIYDFTSTDGTLHLTPSGIHVSGGIGDITFEKFGASVFAPKFDFMIERQKQELALKKTSFTVHGGVGFRGFMVSGTVHVQASRDSGGKLAWTRVAQGKLTSPDFSNASPVLRSALAKIDADYQGLLQGLDIVISDREGAAGTVSGISGDIHRGIQVCGARGVIVRIECFGASEDIVAAQSSTGSSTPLPAVQGGLPLPSRAATIPNLSNLQSLSSTQSDKNNQLLKASLENEFLQVAIQHLKTQLASTISSAQGVAQSHLESVRRGLEVAEEAFNQLCRLANSELEDAQKIWERKQREVLDDVNRAISRAQEASSEAAGWIGKIPLPENARRLWEETDRALNREIEGTKKTLEKLGESPEFNAVSIAKERLSEVNGKASELNPLRDVLKDAEKALNEISQIGEVLGSHAEQQIEIDSIEFIGPAATLLSAFEGAGGSLDVRITGKILGQEREWAVRWKLDSGVPSLADLIVESMITLWKPRT